MAQKRDYPERENQIDVPFLYSGNAHPDIGDLLAVPTAVTTFLLLTIYYTLPLIAGNPTPANLAVIAATLGASWITGAITYRLTTRTTRTLEITQNMATRNTQ